MGLRIPVDHVNAENLAWLVENNLFIAGVALFWGCALATRIKRLASPRVIAALISVGSAFLVASFAIEHYYYSECPIASDKAEATYRILKENTRFFEKQSAEWSQEHPHFLADGTLLCVVRKYKVLMPWDQDTDFYIVYDVEKDVGAEDLVRRLREHHASDLEVVYHPERHLVQIRHASGGHGDMWLWDKREVNGVQCIHNPDFTYQHLSTPGCFHYEWIVPTKTIKWDIGHLSLTVDVPADTASFLTDLFGPRYMEPYRSRMQCTENFAVHAGSHWRIGYTLLSVVVMYLVYNQALQYLENKRAMLPLFGRTVTLK